MSVEVDATVLSSNRTSTPIDESVFDFDGLDGVEKFVERAHFPTDAFEYPREGSDPGYIVIFNQEQFEDDEILPRKGSRRDVNELILCLQRQGYNIGPENLMNDATSDQIKDKLKKVSEDERLENCNNLMIFMLTHGEKNGILLTKDDSLTTEDIWKNFINCKYLKNKPKMFVFQACKGDRTSTTKLAHGGELSGLVHPDTFNSTTMGPDMLVVYSTIEGNYSFRNLMTGSWLIQELCKNITAYGKRDDMFSIITRTMKCVSGNYYSRRKENIIGKQMPVCLSTLSKKFYLNRNKDRALVLTSVRHYKDVCKQIKEFKEIMLKNKH